MRFIVAFIVSLASVAMAPAETINVAAAISLKESMDEVGKAYKTASGDEVKFVYGASGQLLTQIKEGAEIDLFISAANSQVDALVKEKLGDEGTRKVVAQNTLVVVAPADSKLEIKSVAELGAASIKRLALGEPKTVPAGDYATQALVANKVDSAMKDKIVYGANVRQVLDYVINGDVDAGFVYVTDAKQAGAKVKVAFTVDAKDHKPIVYPAIVVLASKKGEAAKKFLEYLGSDDAKKALAERGFVIPAAKDK